MGKAEIRAPGVGVVRLEHARMCVKSQFLNAAWRIETMV